MWKQALSSELEVFVHPHAQQFADELWDFIVSGQSMAAYDRVSLETLQRMQQRAPLPAGESLAPPPLLSHPPPPPLPLHEIWDFIVSGQSMAAYDHVGLQTLQRMQQNIPLPAGDTLCTPPTIPTPPSPSPPPSPA